MKIETVTITLKGHTLRSVLFNSPDGYVLCFYCGENKIRKVCQNYIDVVLITQQVFMQFCLYAGVKLSFRKKSA